MRLCIAEPSGSEFGSFPGLTNDLGMNADLDRPSRAPSCRRRTDAPPTHLHKRSLETALVEARKPKLKSCSICLEYMDSSLWTHWSTRCAHEPRSCGPCIGHYVTHAIKEGLIEILCPDVECRREMKHEEIVARVHGDEESLNRYKALIARKELERHPNFIWCTNAQCERGQIHNQGATSPLVICHHCHAHSCFVHRIPWHHDLTCDQYSRQEENNASEDYINKYMKRCPNVGCKRPIEKIEGCDHMTCRPPVGCGHEFCWTCLADYARILREGNHKHDPGCRHYVGLPSGTGIPDTPRRNNAFNYEVIRRFVEENQQRGRIQSWRRAVSPPPSQGSSDPELPRTRRQRRSQSIPERGERHEPPPNPVPLPELPDLMTLRGRSALTAPLENMLPTPYPQASGSRPRARAWSPPSRPETPNSPYRVLTPCDSLELIRGPSPGGRSVSPDPGPASPMLSELYQPPPTPPPPSPPPVPTIPARFLFSTANLPPLPPRPPTPETRPRRRRRRRVTMQETATISRNRQPTEGPIRDEPARRRVMSEREGPTERQLSSIPDFESEVLLDFIGRRR